MEKKLAFNNSKGNKLVGILTDPSGDKNRPVVVLCHGSSSDKDSKTCVSIAEKLREKDISSFRFDFFAHGESEGNFEDLTVSEVVDNALSAIRFLKNLGYKKIGLFGSSFGGLACYLAAAKTKDIYLLITKAGVANFSDMKEFKDKKNVAKWKKTGYTNFEGKRLKYGFYTDAIKQNAYEVADMIKVPTLILHGTNDQDVPVNQSIDIAKKISNCALEIVVGADHRFMNREHFERMTNSIAAFVVAHSK